MVSSRSAVRGALALVTSLSLGVQADLTLNNYTAYNDGAFGITPNQSFVSSGITAPVFQVNTFDNASVDQNGYLFITPTVGDKHSPMIFSKKDLSLIFANESWPSVSNAQVQTYKGQPYLTFWEGRDLTGHGKGFCLMFDRSYNLAYTISAVNIPTLADSHECQLTMDGTALITAYVVTHPFDLRSAGGPVNGTLLDSVFEEIDIATGESLFTWYASDHFSVSNCTVPYEPEDYGGRTEEVGWDFFHINSLQKTVGGDYLVSGRRLKMAALISGGNGSVIWQVGGDNNMFSDISGGNATNFGYQHHVRFLDPTGADQTHVTMFDNHWLHNTQPMPGCRENCSRALHIQLDFQEMTAALVAEYWHPQSVQSFAMGSYQPLDNGNVLTGWGTIPSVTEWTSDGTCVLDIQTGPFTDAAVGKSPIYRAFQMDWVATPPWNPSLVADNSTSRVYVSWNGATEVASWELSGGMGNGTMVSLQTLPRQGFETAFHLSRLPPMLQATALDSSGKALGKSAVLSNGVRFR